MFWLCSQTNGGLGQWSRIMLFFSAEQDSLQRWTVGKGLAMPHRACVLGSATKQQHGNASNLSATFLHYGVIGSGYSAGIHDVADGASGKIWSLTGCRGKNGSSAFTRHWSAVQWTDIFITLPLWPPQTRAPPDRNRGTFLSEMGSSKWGLSAK